MVKNIQRVVLITTEGTASDEAMLMHVWQERLRKIAPHYNVEKAEILVHRDDRVKTAGIFSLKPKAGIK